MSIDLGKLQSTFYWSRAEIEDPALVQFLPSSTTRLEYLAWVAEWKKLLHATNTEIRAKKAERRDPKKNDWEKNGANNERQKLRIVSHNLQLLRKLAKEKAAVDYNAEKLVAA